MAPAPFGCRTRPIQRIGRRRRTTSEGYGRTPRRTRQARTERTEGRGLENKQERTIDGTHGGKCSSKIDGLHQMSRPGGMKCGCPHRNEPGMKNSSHLRRTRHLGTLQSRSTRSKSPSKSGARRYQTRMSAGRAILLAWSPGLYCGLLG